jgi:peroxiredoxin
MQEIIAGSRVPDVQLASLDGDGAIRAVAAPDLFAYGRALVLGIPGAFTPICTKQHIPDFIQNADRLTAVGYSHLICIAPNDPFVLDAWSRTLDPGRKIEFLSDGNLDFIRILHLEAPNRALFMGRCSQRYLMIVEDGVILRLRVEEDMLKYSCTRAADALEETSVSRLP